MQKKEKNKQQAEERITGGHLQFININGIRKYWIVIATFLNSKYDQSANIDLSCFKIQTRRIIEDHSETSKYILPKTFFQIINLVFERHTLLPTNSTEL
jgi:hypothetical protein